MNMNATLIAQALSFAILIWFTVRFVWPMITDVMDERHRRIADGLAAAERGRQDLELASRRSADLLREARQQAQELIGQAEKRASQIVEEAKAAARVEGDRLIAGARAEIAQEVSRAREMLRTQVAALAVAGAEQILKREVDAQAHAEMLRSVQSQL
ncbi:MAG: F0F1 ATP synthase subunit B [Burkholderiales bacterium]